MTARIRSSRWRSFAVLAAPLALLAGAFGVSNLRPVESGAACCYFAAKDKDINQPGQKAFITWDPEAKVETFTVQAKFEGNAVDFGMVIPTPAQPKLNEMPRDFFKDLAIYTILMPLPQQIWPELIPRPRAELAVTNGPAGFSDSLLTEGEKKDTVRVLEAGVVGSLDYKIIVADKADDLYAWLKEHDYSYGGDEATLGHYIKKQWFFTVMKIDPKQMKKAADGSYLGEVTPTKFTFKSDSCIYPVKITQISVKDQTDALFYVQSPQQMDLKGDLSWMHSYRSMYITYMLGCGAGPELQKEMEQRNQWVQAKKAADPNFETTKLEWAKKLGDAELSVCKDPAANYAQMGTGDLPKGAVVLTTDAFLKELKDDYLKNAKELDDHAKKELARLSDEYASGKGLIVKMPDDVINRGFLSKYMWYPHREAPKEEVAGLTRLQGHLQKDQWLTKFRKVMRKDEMTDDLELVPVAEDQLQTYVRIMPTSPP